MEARKSSYSQFEAVGLALAGYTFWVLADTSLKIAGASTLPAYEITAFVGLSIAVFLLLHGLWRGDVKGLWPRSGARQFLRALLDLANGVCVVIALRHMSLALFYILIFCSPTVTSLMAAVLLGESLSWKKGVAILTGLLGVVVAVHPSLAAAHRGDWQGYAACAVCVLSFSGNMVWSRVMTQSESPESLTFFSGAVMAVAGLLAMLGRAAPVRGELAVVMAAAGLFCIFGSLCFFVALKHAPAATVSQYHYSQLVTGCLLAYLIWRERLTLPMLAGAVLIIGAGFYTAADSYQARGVTV
jgi:drug/metabolite transporter (DMT)-like permease